MISPASQKAALSRDKIATYSQYDALPVFVRNNHFSKAEWLTLKSAAKIIPFKTNDYIISELIDWKAVPNDPVFRMNFPEPKLLHETDLATMRQLYLSNSDSAIVDATCQQIQHRMISALRSDTHRGIPFIDGKPAIGIFHNFAHAVFLFPDIICSCFAHCNYCMRWVKQIRTAPQFTYRDPEYPVSYLKFAKSASDVIFSGGDAFNASAGNLRRYVDPIIKIPHLRTIRFSTRVLSWRPTRFTTDSDADSLLRLLDDIASSGRHVAVMAHLCHPAELSTPTVERAVSRIRSTGAVIRGQGTLLKQVNDSPETLASLWHREVQLGIVPYYLFLESQEGMKPIYKNSFKEALTIFKKAYAQVGGLEKTVRGPVLNTSAMKLLVDDKITVNGTEQLLLKCLHSETPSEIGKKAIAPLNLQQKYRDVINYFRKKMF